MRLRGGSDLAEIQRTGRRRRRARRKLGVSGSARYNRPVAEGEHVRRILHCDMDCYYAAVHVRDDPSLAGRPVVVGGDPEGRGVVATANYEARRYGIHSAMPAARAKRLCPETVFLAPDFPRYRRESEMLFAIYREITPDVETVSLDEAYLDVTGHLGPSGTASEIAKEIRRRVREERRLTVSVGVGPNCLVAKIASDSCKPDGLKVVPPPACGRSSILFRCGGCTGWGRRPSASSRPWG